MKVDMNPRIFIGSSKEGHRVATKIAELLSDTGECTIWNDIFELGKSNYDNLTSQIALFDYAILVATKDDITISRKRKQGSARDNVLFEFGLFAGGLGVSRALYVIEKDVKIPSDLLGISFPPFSNISELDHDETVLKASDEIKKHIKNYEGTFNLSFIPSTAIAYGYFTNFVERTVERLLEDKQQGKIFHLDNGIEFKIQELSFTILIPNDLADDMFKKVKAKRLKDGWMKLKVDPKDVRDYDFSVDISKASEGGLHLVDIPLTLNALNKSVELYSKKQHIGKDIRENLLEYREIRNFKRTLDYLVSKSSLAKDLVRIEIVDI